MRTELQKKVDRAIRLLQSIPTDKGDIEISYSGGKDSDAIHFIIGKVFEYNQKIMAEKSKEAKNEQNERN